MKLIPILLEESADLSDLNKLDDIIAQELEKAEKKQTKEFIGTAITIVTLATAIPGILSIFFKVAKGLIKKSGIKLSIKNDATFSKVENYIEFVANKIDTYVDYPVDVILKKFVKDPIKRKKIIGAIKVGFIVTMALAGAIDISNSSELVEKIKSFSSEIATEVISSAKVKDATKVAGIIKKYINGLG